LCESREIHKYNVYTKWRVKVDDTQRGLGDLEVKSKGGKDSDGE